METTLKGRIKQGDLIFPKTHFNCADCFVDIKITDTSQVITLNMILEAVSIASDKTRDEICGKRRQREFVIPRQVFVYLATKHTQKSLKQIGMVLGCRHHATIIHDRDVAIDRLVKERYKHAKPYTKIVDIANRLLKEQIDLLFF